MKDIEQLLYRLRADIDAELAPRLPLQVGKVYPYGRAWRSRMRSEAAYKRS